MKASCHLCRLAAGLVLLLLIVSSGAWSQEKEDSFAIVEAGIQRSEDAPYVSKAFRFLPGEYLYFTFHVSGFHTKLNEKTEAKSLDLQYEITGFDEHRVPLAESVQGVITGELGREDKNWAPKRRASFLLPSAIAAGACTIHVAVKDLIAKTETTRDFPFQMGGISVQATTFEANSFEFRRDPEDANALDVPAYGAGDTVYARFLMMGFRYEAGNKYSLVYGVKVLRPDGKIFLAESEAAQISADSFYPAPYVPGDLEITTPKNAARGAYQLTLTIRDLVGNQTFDLKRAFTIE